MATPEKHAYLSASSAHRWLNCTASPAYEAQFPDEGTNVYAAEGTLAHSICELYALHEFHPDEMTDRKFKARLKKAMNNELYDDEMLRCADGYVEYLNAKSIELYKETPHIMQEVRVDFSKYVPHGFGTCDCVMIGGDTLHITDYKHGKGVRVDAELNPQMMLYALGALERYGFLYGGIKTVSMGIYQPRISNEASEYVTTVDELIAWAENTVKPLAEEAYNGTGTFKPGEHCRFCKGKAVCKARAENNTALEDFAGLSFPVETDNSTDNALTAPDNTLTADRIGDLLIRGKDLVDWYSDMKEWATQELLQGGTVKGWKLVEGRSVRKILDADKLVSRFKGAGYDEALLYERKLVSLTNLEKLAGKKEFADISDGLIIKPKGAPTLAPATDKRPNYNSADTDSAEISKQN